MERILSEFFNAPPVKKVLDVAAEHCSFERLTLLASLFLVTTYSLYQTPVNHYVLPVLFLLVFFVPRLVVQSWLWGLVTAILLYGNYINWATNDNHQWLFALWALTIAVTYTLFSESDRVDVLRSNGKWMLVLVMLLAVVQKTLDPTYLSGSFFAYTLLTDERFWYLSESLANISVEVMKQGLILTGNMLVDPAVSSVKIHTNNIVYWLGQVITWWVWVIELIIGAFLLLKSRFAQQFAHITNIYFIFVTYTLAPVLGFASLLAVLGFLLTFDKYPKIRLWYIVTFVYLCVLLVVW